MQTMNQKVHIIESVKSLEKNISKIHNSKVLGVDVETKGEGNTWSNPINSELRLVQVSNDSDTLVLDVRAIGYEPAAHYLRPVFEDTEVVKAFHNAKYDMKFIKHHLKIDVERIFDSYIASVLTQGGIRMERGFHGLKAVTKRYTDIDLSKEEQASDWGGELSTKQLQYAAKDSQVLLPVREALIQKLRNLGLFRCAKLEFEAVLPVVWLELCGFYLDFEEWKGIAETNRILAYDISQEIGEELKDVIPQGTLFGEPSINLGSVQQLKKYFTAYGVPMPESTKADFLLPLVKDYPILGKLLEYKKATKKASSFGEPWREFVNPVTGRVHANFNQLGAEDTGRFSCSDPNLQQIPKENLYRNCFKAAEGNTLISGDYSQIELRILADLSNDEYAIQAFADGLDFHTAMAAKISKKAIEDVVKSDRDKAKNVNFAIPYGAGVSRVAATAKIDMFEAEQLVRTYFNAVPNFEKWINKQKRSVLRTHSARTVAGRLGRFLFDNNDGMQRSQAQRNAVNMPIQGSSADILKRALRIFYDNTKDIQDKIKLVNIVHDEINVESPKDIQDEVAKILKDSMEEAGREFVNRVDIKVDIKISEIWVKE